MAVRTNFELFDFLTTGNDFSINAKDLTGNTQTVITSANAVQYMLHKYGTRQYSILRGSSATVSDAFNDFSLDFRLWIMNRQHNIDRMYQALFDYDYSPIENVDRYETENVDRDIDTTYGKKDTLSGSDTVAETGTDTHTLSGNDSTTRSGNVVSETEKAGFNSPNSYTNDAKNTETYNNVKDKTDFGKIDTESKNLSTQTTYGKVDTLSGTDAVNDDTLRTLRVHGNIGVTTNNQLIEAELEMRLKSLAEMLLDNFINDYTFYV